MQADRRYVVMPVPPLSDLDFRLSTADGTGYEDGWCSFSGTSVACAMVAGTLALARQKSPGASLADIHAALTSSIDVERGTSASGDAAGAGFDLATGHGLVHASQLLACI